MEAINRIIVIRFRRVGDAVISTVLCSSLKKTFPNVEIHYVLNENIAPLFEHHSDIDKIIRFSDNDMKSLPVYLSKIKQIMKEGKYDMLVDTRSTVKTLWFSLFSMKTPYRAAKKKAYDFILHNYRTEIECVSDEVTKMLKILSPLEKYFDIKYDRDFKLYVTGEEKECFHEKMKNAGVDFSKPVIVCAVATRVKYKVWKREFMKTVLLNLIEKYDAQLIFNYAGKDEAELALQLHKEMDNHRNVFINIEAKNLRELAAMLANSNFFFGNEGGPRHISQALDIPSFAIYPPGVNKKHWLPNASDRFQGIEPSDILEKAHLEKLSYSEQFDLITPEIVLEKVNKMLDAL